MEHKLDRSRAGRQKRARRLRITEGTGREHLLEVERHKDTPILTDPRSLAGLVVLGNGDRHLHQENHDGEYKNRRSIPTSDLPHHT